MPASKPVVIRLVGLADSPTPFDGQYLTYYDPDKPGIDPKGRPMIATIKTTNDRASAKVFPDFYSALNYWRRTSKPPLHQRPDGKPNRPITAFSVIFEPLD